jgi:hypothetical protein
MSSPLKLLLPVLLPCLLISLPSRLLPLPASLLLLLLPPLPTSFCCGITPNVAVDSIHGVPQRFFKEPSSASFSDPSQVRW